MALPTKDKTVEKCVVVVGWSARDNETIGGVTDAVVAEFEAHGVWEGGKGNGGAFVGGEGIVGVYCIYLLAVCDVEIHRCDGRDYHFVVEGRGQGQNITID